MEIPSKIKWNASWIWLSGEDSAVNRYAFFRKHFVLEDVPDTASLAITADSDYRLWVNGTLIGRGPSRCLPQFQSYDVWDVSRELNLGQNLIAVLGFHEGVSTVRYNLGMPGVLVQLSLPERQVVSDETWMALPGAAWMANVPFEHTFGKRSELRRGHVEVIDLRLYPHGWNELSYKDEHWDEAGLVSQASGWPRKLNRLGAVRRPWEALECNIISAPSQKWRPAQHIHSFDEAIEYMKLREGLGSSGHCLLQDIQFTHSDALCDPAFTVLQDIIVPPHFCWTSNRENFERGEAALQITNRSYEPKIPIDGLRSPRLVLDLGELINGYCELEIEGAAGAVIDIVYAQFLVGGQVAPSYMNSRCADRVILNGQRVRWQGAKMRTARYLVLVVRAAPGTTILHAAGFRQTSYPFKTARPFASGDRELDDLYAAAIRTLSLITTDAFIDNYREQTQYIQTGYYCARAAMSAHGETALTKRLLTQLAQAQAGNGLLPAASPGVWAEKKPAIISECNLFWILTLGEYYLYTGDEEFLKQMLPTLQRIINRYELMENSEGLLEDPAFEFWIDHAPIQHDGINFVYNALYVLALETAERLKSIKDGNIRANRVRGFLREHFWDPNQELFVEGIVEGQVVRTWSEHANAMALAVHIATPEQTSAIVRMFENPPRHVVQVGPLFMHWVFDGLCVAGEKALAFRLVKDRFRHMLDHESGTLWEDWALHATDRTGERLPTARSCAQAEAVFPAYLFHRYFNS